MKSHFPRCSLYPQPTTILLWLSEWTNLAGKKVSCTSMPMGKFYMNALTNKSLTLLDKWMTKKSLSSTSLRVWLKSSTSNIKPWGLSTTNTYSKIPSIWPSTTSLTPECFASKKRDVLTTIGSGFLIIHMITWSKTASL